MAVETIYNPQQTKLFIHNTLTQMKHLVTIDLFERHRNAPMAIPLYTWIYWYFNEISQFPLHNNALYELYNALGSNPNRDMLVILGSEDAVFGGKPQASQGNQSQSQISQQKA